MPALTRNSATVHPVREITLDEQWRIAEKLGRVEIGHPLGGCEYRAQIRFKRRSGTTIWAKGIHTDVVVALGIAINEAREMGAGEPS